MPALAWLSAWLTLAPLSGAVPVRSPAVFCADGSVAFIGGEVDQPGWYRASLDAGEPQPFYPDPPYDRAAAAWWSPDGGRMAYLATVGGRLTLQVWVLSTGVAQTFAVLAESPRPGFQPEVAWSRDGQRLAFTRQTEGDANLPYGIFVLGADGAGPLREVLSPYPPESLAWDWTATRLAHVAKVGLRRALLVTFMDPARVVTIGTNLTVLPRAVTFTPDGRRILFGGTGDPQSGVRLFVSRADGQLPAVRVRHNGYLPDRPLSWSPDGSRLAWCTGSLSRPDRGRLQLLAADALDRPQPAARDRSWLVGPVFSPDSRRLALTSYLASTGSESEVVLVALGEPSRSVALAGPANAAWPVWSPDGKWLTVVADVGDHRGLYLLPAPGE